MILKIWTLFLLTKYYFLFTIIIIIVIILSWIRLWMWSCSWIISFKITGWASCVPSGSCCTILIWMFVWVWVSACVMAAIWETVRQFCACYPCVINAVVLIPALNCKAAIIIFVFWSMIISISISIVCINIKFLEAYLWIRPGMFILWCSTPTSIWRRRFCSVWNIWIFRSWW